MLEAIFLDMDETLCPTSLANDKALYAFENKLAKNYPQIDVNLFSHRYLQGIYKKLNQELPHLTKFSTNEELFRCELITTLFQEQEIKIDKNRAQALQDYFSQARMDAFDFFPQVKDSLVKLRNDFKLVVITNGPTYSQIPKVEKLNLKNYVDHILIGGQEPQEKPHPSIFKKALKLADCSAHQALHIGDSLDSDILGAQSMGIPNVWVASDNKDEQARASIIKPNYILNNPSDLLDIIYQHSSNS